MNKMSIHLYVIFVSLMWTTQVVSGQHGSGHGSQEHGSSEGRLDPFEEISQASFLSVQQFSSFIDSLFDNFLCSGRDHDEHESDSSHEECEKSLCLNAEDLIEHVGGNSSEGIKEDEFGNASIILLYLLTDLDHYCQEKVNVSFLSLEHASSHLLNLTYAASPDHPHIHSSGIRELLNTFKVSINHEDHDHDGDDDHHDEDDDHHDEDEDHHDEDDDHHDGDGDHDDEDDDHHDEDGDHHDEESDDHDEDGNHHDEDDDSNDDNHESGDHDENNEDHHNHGLNELVVQARCLASDALLYYMGKESSDFIESEQLGELASITVYLLAQGSDVQESCRLLPQKSDFSQNLFNSFDGTSSQLSIEGLERLMTSLGVNPEADDHGDSHDGHGHRRKRSAYAWSNTLESKSRRLSHRVRRQASVNSQFTQCYSAEQLAALYEASSYLDQSTFQQLCPSLISQRLYGDCTLETTNDDLSDAEKYGYSSLAVFIICLCSILGVVLILCVSSKIYNDIMALFLGLAVGTLFSDAILHLIPSAFGVHGHEDGHDHGSEIVLEEFARYGLVIIAALYFFYIIELIMSNFGGHSHGDDKSHSFNHSDHEHVNAITMNTMNGDEEKGKKYQVAGSDVKSNGHAASSQTDIQSSSFLGISPVAFMIVLGDAIHNCADGLVIGASFSQGKISSGIATSIAVFCHELPHELGDFAVLVQSGCSFSKAVCLNLLSSLTAFIGLYIGLSLSTDSTTERWIVAIASGMFIYIALVDLLPQLVKSRGFNIVLNNIGLLVGFGIMLLLVVFEEHIEV